MRPISRQDFDRALASNELHIDRMSGALKALLAVEGIDPARIAGTDRVIRQREWGALFDLLTDDAPVQRFASLPAGTGTKRASIEAYHSCGESSSR